MVCGECIGKVIEMGLEQFDGVMCLVLLSDLVVFLCLYMWVWEEDCDDWFGCWCKVEVDDFYVVSVLLVQVVFGDVGLLFVVQF